MTYSMVVIGNTLFRAKYCLQVKPEDFNLFNLRPVIDCVFSDCCRAQCEEPFTIANTAMVINIPSKNSWIRIQIRFTTKT